MTILDIILSVVIVILLLVNLIQYLKLRSLTSSINITKLKLALDNLNELLEKSKKSEDEQ